MNTYRNSEIVSAYRLENAERMVTRDGVRDVDAGTWVLHSEDGVRLMEDAAFRARYEVWDGGEAGQGDSGESGPENQPESVPEFSPVGRTVDEVTAYLRGVGDAERARVLAVEGATNSPRKGIMEFTG